jgi:antitoxin ParD1/3/4
MPNVEKVSVSMTPQHAELLRDAVNSGAYASGSEVVRQAMRDWSAKWMQKREDIAKLRAMWEEGKASGPSVEVDFDAVLDEARQDIASAAPHAR